MKEIKKTEKKYMKDLMANPYLNIVIEDFFEVHKNRLKEHTISMYHWVTYYLGKKVGLYSRSSKGSRIYI